MPAAGLARARRRRGPVGLALAVAVAGCALGGCRSRPRNFENVNDKLRRQNLELHDQIRELEGKLELASTQVRSLQRQAAATQPDRPAGAELAPAVVHLDLDRPSGTVDTDGDGQPDLLRLYVKTRDARGRFILTVGQAVVQVVDLQPQQPPRLIVEQVFTPQAFDESYRGTLLGPHYTLEVPLATDLLGKTKELTVSLTLTDAITGATLTTQRVVPVHPAADERQSP